MPNIARNSIISAAELATYDEVKTRLLASGLFEDNIGTHLMSGVAAGFVATMVGSPVDVTKTRVMNQRIGPNGEKQYKHAFDCMYQIAKKEGFGGFYKGVMPNFARIASWNVVMFLSYEQLKGALSTPVIDE
eukprot:TRINITY_DN67435_c5_g4_i2.p1 TRINITY_DN67435_c5_g4~~TRINITY_DN67435_c5_g4_i2.p1  ORF type:complete len:132 (-),score=59.68 TRINITY_DN67435_c5_g4_i2:55-450(-)